jgi:hypothetical protein
LGRGETKEPIKAEESRQKKGQAMIATPEAKPEANAKAKKPEEESFEYM